MKFFNLTKLQKRHIGVKKNISGRSNPLVRLFCEGVSNNVVMESNLYVCIHAVNAFSDNHDLS